jgi:uncharacterized protein YciI
MPVFAVFHTYDDREAERMALRSDPRPFLFGLQDRGTLLAAGAVSDTGTTPGAVRGWH